MTTPTPHVLKTILDSPDLPTLPTVAAKLLTLMSLEDTSLAEIAELVAQDAALSVRIIRVANSSFYGFAKQISSVQQAVSLLGSNAIRSLVLSFSLMSLKASRKSRFDYTRFWECSLAGAAAAKAISRQVPDTDQGEIFTAGLLQNIGQLIFAATIPDAYEQFLGYAGNGQEGPDLERQEQEILGITHSIAGSEVARRWDLPDFLVQVIRYHHSPSEYADRHGQLADAIKVVYLADLLARVFYSTSPDKAHSQFCRDANELLGLDEPTIDAILLEVVGEIDAAAEYFGLKIPPTKSVMEILQEANVNLSLLNLTYEELNRKLKENKIALEKLAAELAHKNHLLEVQLHRDYLTEVANHRHFQTILEQELNRASRDGGTLSLLMIDIDWFKKVNDTYGHLAGDFVLKEFCVITGKNIRGYDLLARYGGEEFAVILPGATQENALCAAEKIRKRAEEHLFKDNQHSIRITVSIGVASVRPAAECVSQFEFISRADEALYQAKGNGRNRVACYDSAYATVS